MHLQSDEAGIHIFDIVAMTRRSRDMVVKFAGLRRAMVNSLEAMHGIR